MVGDLIINGGANESKLNNNTLRVCADGCNYSSIQSAIHAAIPWSVIEVQNGSYDEDLNITKPLLFKSVGGMVFYEGTIMPFHYPVTFSGENHKNHFASVYLDSPPWHHRCEACESYEQFSECYQEFVDAAPSNAKIWRDYAADQKEIWQKYEDALASIDQALQIDPRFSEAWEIKGILLNKLGRYQDAVTACERAIELDRFDDGAWSEKGFAFCQMKSYEEAILA
ncbi:MAG TPA: tetratricopeptide repeat protein, partial [Methanothrix sp.]|nr:tetratricopeptide repeat protein [Methanothrix sp.]